MPKSAARKPVLVAPVTADTSNPAVNKGTADSPTTPKLLPLGIHFDLDEALYHADPGLGSGNIRQLARNPCDYWYGSWMNPRRKPSPEKEYFIYGRAQHRIIFDGREAFDRQFVCGPDQEGMTSGEKGVSTKAAKAEAAKAGKLLLPRDDYERIVIAGAMVTMNPHLKDVFSGGQGEVSVIWGRDGVRLKARFDYLKVTKRTLGTIAANGDLKTVQNERGRYFPTACNYAISDLGYHVQAAHYLAGLMLVPGAIMSDAVYCHGEEVDGEWLGRFLTPGLKFGWQWIFLQKTGAPITHSLTLSPQNPMLKAGAEVVERGITRYREFMEKFGPDTMWLLVEPPQEAMIEDMPFGFGR